MHPQAFTLYRKTRPGASLESIKRARDLGPEGIHPLLARELPASQIGADTTPLRTLLAPEWVVDAAAMSWHCNGTLAEP
jgi:hypothetical protein